MPHRLSYLHDEAKWQRFAEGICCHYPKYSREFPLYLFYSLSPSQKSPFPIEFPQRKKYNRFTSPLRSGCRELIAWWAATLYFFMSGLNFFIPRLIPSASGMDSCVQYFSKISLHSLSNRTWVGFPLGLEVGLPGFLSATFSPPPLLCSTKL